jgi:hypothetical protein
MTINPYPSQQEILALLRTIPNLQVFEGRVPDGVSLAMTPKGKILPFLEVSFAGLTEPPKGTNGITGPQDDSFVQKFSVHGVGSDDDAARQAHSLAWLKLIGFSPTGCAQVCADFFAGIGQISSLSQPTRYSAVQAYKYLIL